MQYKVTGAGHSVCVCVCVCGGGCQRVRVQWCMGQKRGGGERRERVELPDSLMSEAVLHSAGPRLESTQSPP